MMGIGGPRDLHKSCRGSQTPARDMVGSARIGEGE
jgi:hypothetical protein